MYPFFCPQEESIEEPDRRVSKATPTNMEDKVGRNQVPHIGNTAVKFESGFIKVCLCFFFSMSSNSTGCI